MCIKSNRLLRGYATQLKSASNTVENIRNELFMMFNNEKHTPHQHQLAQMPVQQHPQQQQHKQDAGPSTNKLYARQQQQPRDDKVKQESPDQIQKPDLTCFDIKSEFVNELTATCSSAVMGIAAADTFNFELKPAGQHQCTLCHKCFSRESVLTRHMLIHSGERPHHCNVCNKNFTHKFNLKQHMLIHSGHKTHHCSVCDKGFIKKSDLDRHMLTHFGERIHHCSICGKSFVRKENLNQHILTHTGQKPHHCTQCTKSFLRKSDLNRHMLLCISKRAS